jgi:hypothetical protein
VTRRSPVIVAWTAHALARADSLDVPRSDIQDALVAGHGRRRANPREADWLLDVGRYTVAYNHPHADDKSVALVVTVWRRA